MPVACTAPAVLSTVTVPGVPVKTAKPGCGCMAVVVVPVASVHTGAVVDQVPLPPPACTGLARPLAFQKFSVMPVVLTSMKRLSALRFWIDSVAPAGTLPSASALPGASVPA